ncbi:hypothetical protein [Variovorax rhizosphaerae]|uniref:Glycine zipper 2TM domain-containing protein n=1 Tax=Variovorax rhizosphaerae TaxID=1836200 RepID=A0ABU8WTY9_9BURK
MNITTWQHAGTRAIVAAVILSLAGCQAPGPTAGSSPAGAQSQSLSPAEMQLREDEERFNNTVISAVLTGAAGGALLGGVLGAVTGRKDKKSILTGAAAGAVVGGTALGIDGYLTAKKEQAGRQNVRAAQAAAADVQQDNNRLQAYLDTSSRVLAEGQARLAKLQRDIAAKKVSTAEAQQARAREEKNIASMNQTLTQARKTRQEYAEASEKLKGSRENTRDMDGEIRRMDQQIGQLESTVSAYNKALSVSKA